MIHDESRLLLCSWTRSLCRSRNYLENQMAVALGGRIAEELIFGEDDITTGEKRP